MLAALASCLLTTSLEGLEGPPLETPAADATSDGSGVHDVVQQADASDASDSARASDAPDGGPVGPTLLVQTGGRPRGIAVVGTRLYWVENEPDHLVCMPKQGPEAGAPRYLEIPSELSTQPFDIGADDTYAYWSANTVVYRKVLRSGDPCGSDVAGASYFPGTGTSPTTYLAVANGLVYVTDGATVVVGADIVTTVGSPPVPSVVLYPEQPGAAGIAFVNDTLVWGRDGGLAAGTADPTVPGPIAQDLGSVSGVTSGVASDGSSVYFISDDVRIMKMNLGAPGTPVTLWTAGEPFGQSDIAVDDQKIYFTKFGEKQIWTMPK